MGSVIITSAQYFLYIITAITMVVVIGGLPRPWKSKRK
jgi:hypothetical protein